MRHAKPRTPVHQAFWGAYRERMRALPRYGGKLETDQDLVMISVIGVVAVLVLVATAVIAIVF